MTNINEDDIKERVANATIEEIYGLCVDLGIIDPEKFTLTMLGLVVQLMYENPDISEDELIAYVKSYDAYRKYQ